MQAETSPGLVPNSSLRNRIGRDDEIADSSADESTAIVRNPSRADAHTYGSTASNGVHEEEEDRLVGYDAATENAKKKNSVPIRSKGNPRNTTPSARRQGQTQTDEATDETAHWFRSLVEKYGTVELDNKGSVARDHLALERTFLAWLRTSMAFASIGIAVTQLFRLSTSIPTSDADQQVSIHAASDKLRSVGKPLGSTFLAISILILLLGVHRYFESQHYVIRGKFPASRGTIVIVSVVATALIVASFVVVIAVAPEAFKS